MGSSGALYSREHTHAPLAARTSLAMCQLPSPTETSPDACRWVSKMRKSARVAQSLVERRLASDDASLEEQLRAAIAADAERVREAFLTWDSDGDGGMNKSEFRHAVQVLGLRAAPEEVDALFNDIDTNSDGTLSFRELHRAIAKRKAKEKAERRRKRVGEEEVAIADFSGLRSELRESVKLAEENWYSTLSEYERAHFRHQLDDSMPDPDSIR